MIFRHIHGTSTTAVFSDCKKYRYRLTIQNHNSSGSETVCVIMQNPSVANAEIADKSVQFLEKLIFTKGYSEFRNVKRIIIVNQFAFVKTNDFNGSESHIGQEKDAHILAAIRESDIVLIAWGRGNRYSERKSVINTMLAQHSGKTLLETKSHPSRGTYTNFIQPYSIFHSN